MHDATPELWVPIVGYEGRYEVSDLGHVRTLRRARVKGGLLKPDVGEYGHLSVSLYIGQARKHRGVHQLVAEAFIGRCPEGLEVRHLDGNAANNKVGNLAYGTHAENMQDMIRHGTAYWSRITHCPRDHEYTPGNTYWLPGRKGRMCRTCMAIERQQRPLINIAQGKLCSKGNCGRPVMAKGLCGAHYCKQWRANRQ